MAGSFTVGTRVRVNATFRNAAGALFDPAALTFTFAQLVAGKVQSVARVYTYGVDAEIHRTSVGLFYFELLLADVGTYAYRWQSSALTEELTIEGSVDAKPRSF